MYEVVEESVYSTSKTQRFKTHREALAYIASNTSHCLMYAIHRIGTDGKITDTTRFIKDD